ncbi:MAG TPA: dihydrodipicolinate reductase C-terminal domain-containing protein [Bdellovibrionota bacterium]|jgi:4-hydroxy-tetrahydrodipicolinate reductase|nr:dihydrodipicolinate reductase C-terminal domain-containing protein [Bdellovibrionota bacterium]
MAQKPEKLRIGVLGANGRMGTEVRRILGEEHADRTTLAAPVDRGGDLDSLMACRVVIDFSLPEAVAEFLKHAESRRGKFHPALVVGSTGWTPAQRAALEEYSNHAPVLQSANFSLGVQALRRILRQSAPLFKVLGYKPRLEETHHTHKRDAPSGTAVALRDEIAPAYPGLEIPIQSYREGEVVGDHSVMYEGPSDRILFRHVAQDRGLFARGAIQAALWVATLEPWAQSGRGILGLDRLLEDLAR